MTIMNAFSKIDMAEVARLTRVGKLTEAMALIQGGAPQAGEARGDSQADAPSGASPRLRAPEPAPSGRRSAAEFAPLGKLGALKGLKQTLKAFRERAPGMAPLTGLGEARGRASVATPEGARFEERTFANGAGSRTYKIYVPSGYKGQPLPVVVMLHGCTQNPDDFAAGTRMNELAEEQTFLVAYPRQPQSANMQKCWNWFDGDHQLREGGEPSLIAGLTRQVVAEFHADPRRVYVAGLSAGGAAAAVLAMTHPDIFAAVGVHSGLACGAAKDMSSAFAAMAGGGTLRERGEGAIVPTIVFHGDADRTVHLANAGQVVSQAKAKASLIEVVTHGETPDGMTYTQIVQIDAADKEVVEQWVLHGAGHAWSGGSLAGSFTEPRGPDASREMIRFFLRHENDGARRGD